MTVAKRIIAAAELELGVHEIPAHSNSGARVKQYQATTWLPGTGWPWCVAFAWTWLVWGQVLHTPCPYPTASVEQLEAWARLHGWAAIDPRPGDLACLGHGRHVTIVHHLLPGGVRFAGIGGNQSDSVRISEYARSDISTLVRVPASYGKLPYAPAPRYEVVRGEGEKAHVVFTGGKLDATVGRAQRALARGARVVTIRRTRP